jgi:aldose 1-epimerase
MNGVAVVPVELTRAPFGTLADGRSVEAVTLTNNSGVSARVITYGATLQSLMVPDASGRVADVVLGYADLESYVAKPEYFGSTVGRVANRIAKGQFKLDGRTYDTVRSEGEHTLHGGRAGFDKVLWRLAATPTGASASVTLEHISPDGEQGFPGTLAASALYALNEQNELTIEYRATTDRPTVVNMTNHAIWNLAGEGSADGAMEQWLMIPADRYTPVDATLIPTGELRPVAGTAFDFRIAKPIVRDVRDSRDPQIEFGRGFDHNWVISDTPVPHPRLVARAEDRASGRVLEVLSDQPGIQFYSGNFLNGTRAGKSGRLYRQGDGFALEPQLFPDVVNRPAFGSARLAPGEVYGHRIVYRLSARKI